LYGGLSDIYPEVVASGIYHAYVESSAATQLVVIGTAKDMSQKQIADALGIGAKRVQRRLAVFRRRVLERVPSLSGFTL
jgi:hypothetical protein